MARTDPQINLRLPEDLKKRVTAAAQASGRSTNAEIVHRLQGSVDGAEGSPKRDVVIEALLEAVGEALRWWDAVDGEPDASEYRDSLKSAMDDLEMWQGRLQRLDSSR